MEIGVFERCTEHTAVFQHSLGNDTRRNYANSLGKTIDQVTGVPCEKPSRKACDQGETWTQEAKRCRVVPGHKRPSLFGLYANCESSSAVSFATIQKADGIIDVTVSRNVFMYAMVRRTVIMAKAAIATAMSASALAPSFAWCVLCTDCVVLVDLLCALNDVESPWFAIDRRLEIRASELGVADAIRGDCGDDIWMWRCSPS